MRDQERKTLPKARALRKTMTRAEVILWQNLRRKQLAGAKFRRQVPIGPYIADFACINQNLVIEVDGETHSSEKERQYDQRRTGFLKKKGWYVHRVWNRDVYDNLEGVLDGVLELMDPAK